MWEVPCFLKHALLGASNSLGIKRNLELELGFQALQN